ncbi:MAG: glycosyltransferase family 2 protein [Elusimicrobiota bacterium]
MVSAIITAKNEARTIAEAVQACKPHCDEIIVVDGHSDDGTSEIAEKAGARVIQDNGRGKGEATRLGLDQAKGDILIVLTSDGSDEYAKIPALIAPIRDGKADLVVGSRFEGGSEELSVNAEQLIRTMGNISLNVMINWRWNTYLTDVLNGFRAVSRSAYQDLDCRCDSAAVEVEMVVKALAFGYRVTNTPTHEYARKYGDTRLTVWKEGIKIYWCVFKHFFTPSRAPRPR